MLPKYKLQDQVLVKDNSSIVAMVITGMSQTADDQPFRYESTTGSSTTYIDEYSIVAVVENGEWQKV